VFLAKHFFWKFGIQIVHFVPKLNFCIDFRAEGFKMLRNSLKYRFGSNVTVAEVHHRNWTGI
jgi:hypothetical protein